MKKRIGVVSTLLGFLTCMSFSNAQQMTEEEILAWAKKQSDTNSGVLLSLSSNACLSAKFELFDVYLEENRAKGKFYNFEVIRMPSEQVKITGYLMLPHKIKTSLVGTVQNDMAELKGMVGWSMCTADVIIKNFKKLEIEK